MRGWMVVALLAAGCGSAEYDACEDLCTELVRTCDYQAYPEMQSCMDGCANRLDEGVDVEAYATCVQDAACNTFQIVECEHRFATGE